MKTTILPQTTPNPQGTNQSRNGKNTHKKYIDFPTNFMIKWKLRNLQIGVKYGTVS